MVCRKIFLKLFGRYEDDCLSKVEIIEHSQQSDGDIKQQYCVTAATQMVGLYQWLILNSLQHEEKSGVWICCEPSFESFLWFADAHANAVAPLSRARKWRDRGHSGDEWGAVICCLRGDLPGLALLTLGCLSTKPLMKLIQVQGLIVKCHLLLNGAGHKPNKG